MTCYRPEPRGFSADERAGLTDVNGQLACRLLGTFKPSTAVGPDNILVAVTAALSNATYEDLDTTYRYFTQQRLAYPSQWIQPTILS